MVPGSYLDVCNIPTVIDSDWHFIASLSKIQKKNALKRLFQILFPFRFSQNIEQSPLCCTAGPCWLSILNIAVST